MRESQSLDTVGQFAAGVAEHFDDLLTVIRANSQLLLEPSGTTVVATPAADTILGRSGPLNERDECCCIVSGSVCVCFPF